MRSTPLSADTSSSTSQVISLPADIVQLLQHQPPFQAGSISRHFTAWTKLTSDNNILTLVKGFTLELLSVPQQVQAPQQLITKPSDLNIAIPLLNELRLKNVIESTVFHPRGFISNIFLREKKNGKHRLILNLKPLNRHVEYHHFKMETLTAALLLMSPHCFMASIDLTDAYYSVNVSKAHRKFLQFQFQGRCYRFTCLANGIGSAPRTFTKLLKVPLSHLRESFGIHITAYLDDLFLVAHSPDKLLSNIKITCQLLQDLGFAISSAKSVLVPSISIQYLGFTLNSQSMQITQGAGKPEELKTLVHNCIQADKMTIREFAGVLGKLAATLPGNKYGMVFLKTLETQKARALSRNNYSYEGTINISPLIKTELRWWLENIELFSRPVHVPNPDITIFTDASLQGWGCHLPHLQIQTGGRWGPNEWGQDINYLELNAILLSLLTCCRDYSNKHILIRSDNTTAVSGINRQGSTHSVNCNNITRQIWTWAMDTKNWLSASHCPGVLNVEADIASRLFNDSTEWTLDNKTFNHLCKKFGTPTIDLFASRLNFKLDTYCAWLPDPGASKIDCFTLDWSMYSYIYAFPPFSLVARTLRKIIMDGTDALVIVPHWPSQAWFSTLQQMLREPPHVIHVRPGILTLPHDPTIPHPLQDRLRLWGCKVSGKTT